MAEIPEQEKIVTAADRLHMHKGEAVVLSQDVASLRVITVGLGWDAPEKVDLHAVDIDASAFLLNRDGRVRNDLDFVFYNNLETPEGSVTHGGDNTTGAGEGDDEVIRIDLERVPFDIDRIAFSVTIHNAEERQQTFGLVKSAFIRIVNDSTGAEIAHYDLSEDAEKDTALIFGEMVRDGMGWRFKAVGAGSSGGLYKIARDYGVNVSPA